jgi:serine/threonine protein kinase
MSPRQYEDDDAESLPDSRFLLPQLRDADTEDVEKYQRGGLHPVHLGDIYDGRYRVVHKLGAGGFSTVWLARDDTEHRWVALKIVVADYSTSVSTKSQLSCHAASQCTSDAIFGFVVERRHFTLDGPNGRHLCLVLPVLGPSASDLSKGIYSRITPPLSRRASYQATRALANLHAQGLCHGGESPLCLNACLVISIIY